MRVVEIALRVVIAVIRNDGDIVKMVEKARLEGLPPYIVTRIYHGMTVAPDKRTTIWVAQVAQFREL